MDCTFVVKKINDLGYEKVAGILDLTVNELKQKISDNVSLEQFDDESLELLLPQPSLILSEFKNCISNNIERIANRGIPGIFNFIVPPESAFNDIIARVISSLPYVSYSKHIISDDIYKVEMLDLTSCRTHTTEQDVIELSSKKPVIIITAVSAYNEAKERIVVPSLTQKETIALLADSYSSYNIDYDIFKKIAQRSGFLYSELKKYMKILNDYIKTGKTIDYTIF